MLDNYDSFTYNLVHLFEELGADVVTVRNDAITVDAARAGGFDRLVVSPGPGRPEAAGVSIELIRALGPTMPTLGVCLGHQAIVEAFGGTVGHAKALLHGKASTIHPRRPRRLRRPPGRGRGRPLPLAGGARGPGRARDHSRTRRTAR